MMLFDATRLGHLPILLIAGTPLLEQSLAYGRCSVSIYAMNEGQLGQGQKAERMVQGPTSSSLSHTKWSTPQGAIATRYIKGDTVKRFRNRQ